MFSGIGGVDCGAIMAGVTPVGGVEYDPKIAEIATANNIHLTVGDVLEVLPECGKANILHASPPCPSFSMANNNRGETAHDVALSGRVADYAQILEPDIITVENVPLYRLSQSWLLLQARLMGMGYFCTAKIVNMADYGVPQTRERMIAVFSRGLCPVWGMAQENWVSWYDAIGHLLPEFQERTVPPFISEKFAQLPDNCLFDISTSRDQKIHRESNQPSMTLLASNHGEKLAIKKDGQCLKVSCKARALLQSFPAHYYVPENGTGQRGTGNAVPPLFYAKLLRELGVGQ